MEHSPSGGASGHAWLTCVALCGSALSHGTGQQPCSELPGPKYRRLFSCLSARERLTFHFSPQAYSYVLSPDGVLQRGPRALGTSHNVNEVTQGAGWLSDSLPRCGFQNSHLALGSCGLHTPHLSTVREMLSTGASCLPPHRSPNTPWFLELASGVREWD